MNTLRKYFGIVWFILGLLLAVFLPYQAIATLSEPGATQEDYVFWIVTVAIFVPITIGFILFGYYAYQEEYSE